MNINCFCIVQDLVLNYILKKYIEKTPFLSYSEGDINKDVFYIKDFEKLDLIIAEINIDTKDKIYRLLSQFENKYFFLLSDIESLLKPIENNKTVIFKKDIAYSDFINGLNTLVS